MYSIIPLRDLMEENDGSLETTLDSYHDCIGSDQEQFLKTKAIMMEKKNMCRSYLAIGNDRKIIGYSASD